MTIPNYAYQQTEPVTIETGAKVAWFFIGFMLGIAGALLAYVTNLDKRPAVKGEPLKYAIIGLVCSFIWNAIFSFGFFMMAIAPLMAYLSNLSYYY